jgi:energy-coupling factor transport system ATP-binding protein
MVRRETAKPVKVRRCPASADRIVLMSQGEVIANSSPHDVPANSPLFAPQTARLFPETGWLTIKDVLRYGGHKA